MAQEGEKATGKHCSFHASSMAGVLYIHWNLRDSRRGEKKCRMDVIRTQEYVPSPENNLISTELQVKGKCTGVHFSSKIVVVSKDNTYITFHEALVLYRFPSQVSVANASFAPTNKDINMANRRKWFVFSLLAGLLVASCNVFNPAENRYSDDGTVSRYGAEVLVIEGKVEMSKGNWEKARTLFERAIDADPTKSEAYFYAGKCILRIYNVDVTEIWEQIDPDQNVRSGKEIPFLYAPYRPREGRNGQSDTTCTLEEDPPARTVGIIDFLTGAERDIIVKDTCIDGVWNEVRSFDRKLEKPFSIMNWGPAHVVIDSVFLERKRVYDAISQAFLYLDSIANSTRMDGMIKRKQYESDYLVESAVKTVLGIADMNNNGRLDYTEKERRAFRVACGALRDLNNMQLDSLKQVDKDPKTINERIDSVLNFAIKARDSHRNLNSEIVDAGLSTEPIDDIGNVLDTLVDMLPFYYYDDWKDNDNSYWNTETTGELGKERIDRMIWIDWDGDDLIDVNDGDLGGPGHVHIGDSAHMFPHGHDHTKPYFGLDQTKYELVDLYPYMDSCHFIMRNDSNFLVYGNLDEPSRFSLPDGARVVDTIPVPFHSRYRYKGPHTFEFIAGDWSVDEEIMDGVDNDQDGLVDEDTRIVADTLDDDGDWYNTTGDTELDLPVPTVMVWGGSESTFSAASVYMSFVDTTAAGWVKVPKINKYATQSVQIGEYYNLHYGLAYPDYVWQYRGGHSTGTLNGFHRGDYGLDEELFDGLDNDGDGLIDEDVGERLPPKSMRTEIQAAIKELYSR